MTRWLLVPLSLAALVVVTPTSEAGLFGRKKGGCSNGYSNGSYCGPTQTIVGYRTEKRQVTSHEWVTESKKVQVTEYRSVEEKRKVTYNKSEMVKEVRPQKYMECVPVTTEEVREYTVQVPVRETRKATRHVTRPVTVEETREFTVYTEVRETKKGTRQVCRPITVEETVNRTYDRGHWETSTYEVPCYSNGGRRGFCCNKGGCESDCVTYRTVCRRHWVPNVVTVAEKVNVTRNQMVEEPYEYVAISHKPERKSEKVKVTRYQSVEEPYTYEVVSYRSEKKSEKVKVTRSQMVEKTRDVTYWVSKTTPVTEEVVVRVSKPFTVEKDVQVRVCHPVTREVDVQVPIYGVVECAQPAPVYYYDCGSSNGYGSRRGGCCK